MNSSQVLPKRLLKATEVAKILNISRAFAYQLIQRGDIPAVSIGSSRRVRPIDLQEYISSHVAGSALKWE